MGFSTLHDGGFVIKSFTRLTNFSQEISDTWLCGTGVMGLPGYSVPIKCY